MLSTEDQMLVKYLMCEDSSKIQRKTIVETEKKSFYTESHKIHNKLIC